jgi:hypothetical protein
MAACLWKEVGWAPPQGEFDLTRSGNEPTVRRTTWVHPFRARLASGEPHRVP